jgi:DNA-binding MurR/RpiR family transcriptional regulator
MTPGSKRAAKETPRSLDGRIHAAYGDLSAAERKLAEVILAFPGDVAAYSATELADLAGVSKAAATRFFKRLGFRSFEEARRLARDTRDWGAPLYVQSHLDEGGDLGADLQRYLAEEMRALNDTFAELDRALVAEITARLVSARRLWLVGFRNSHFIAGYAKAQFVQFRDSVHLLPPAGETMAEYLPEMTAEDLLIAVGMRRRLGALPRLLARARARRVPILLITDPTARRTADAADWVLTCRISSSFLFDSYAAPLSLVRFLAIEAFRLAGKEGRHYLETIEREHEALKDFA